MPDEMRTLHRQGLSGASDPKLERHSRSGEKQLASRWLSAPHWYSVVSLQKVAYREADDDNVVCRCRYATN
jgi:hypothetical protein